MRENELKYFFVIKVLEDLETYLKKAIPDTKLTIKKYADVKFEYLSYCLKVKEMDDEEVSYCTIGEPLYRVEAGNIEYRYVIFFGNTTIAKSQKVTITVNDFAQKKFESN